MVYQGHLATVADVYNFQLWCRRSKLPGHYPHQRTHALPLSRANSSSGATCARCGSLAQGWAGDTKDAEAALATAAASARSEGWHGLLFQVLEASVACMTARGGTSASRDRSGERAALLEMACCQGVDEASTKVTRSVTLTPRWKRFHHTVSLHL